MISRRQLLCGLVLWAAFQGAVWGAATPQMHGDLILVAGGSGREGHRVVIKLLQAARPVRALTRDRDEAERRFKADPVAVDWWEADVRIPTDMVRVMRGVDSVICVIGSRQVEGANSPAVVDYGGVENLVRAARAQGVRHFVLLTAIGVTDPAHPFNKITHGALQWRLMGEQSLRTSGLAYTIVRPGGLVDTPGHQIGVRLAQGDQWQQFLKSTLSRDDLADVLIDSLTNPAAVGKTFEIVNDPGLPPGTWRSTLAELKPD